MIIKRYLPIVVPSFHLMISYLSFAVSGVFFWWLAAKLYSLEEIGMGAVFISVSSMLIFFSSLGIAPTFIRYLPEQESKREVINSLFIFSFFLLAVLYLIFLLGINPLILRINFLYNPADAFLFFALVFFLQVSHNLDGLFISFKATHFVLNKNIFQSFSRIIFLILLVPWKELGIFSSGAIGAAGAGVIFAPLFIRKFSVSKLKISFHFRVLRKTLLFSLANFLNIFSIFFPGAILPLVVFHFFSKADVAFFYIPWVIFSLWASFINSITDALLMRASSGDNTQGLIRRAVEFALFVSVVGFIPFYFFGDKILFFFKEEFSLNSFTTLKILFSSLLFFAINQIYITLLNIRKAILGVGLISAVIVGSMLVLSILFLPQMKGEGIAYAWLISNFIGNIYVLTAFLKKPIRMFAFLPQK